MVTGFYNLDGIDYEYNIIGKTVYNTRNDKPIQRIWAYPVRQAVLGGEPITRYFTTSALRDAYMANHDYCDKLSRRKVPEMD